MNILGLYGWFGGNCIEGWVHDAGASLFKDGKHVSSISEERLSRLKHDGEYPYKSIKYTLSEGGIKDSDIDIVSYVRNMHTFESRAIEVRDYLELEFPNAKILIVDHHLSHAAASFYTSPFSESSIYTQDGGGNRSKSVPESFNTGTYSIGYKNYGIELLLDFINGYSDTTGFFNLGQVYNNVSVAVLKRIGAYDNLEDTNHPSFLESSAGKVMGLAAYGDYRNIDIPNIIRVEYDGFNFPTITSDSPLLIDSKLRAAEAIKPIRAEDLASWIQNQYRNSVVEYFRAIKTKEKSLCMGGGCALNVLTNRALLDEGVFESVHVFPGANDMGLAFGGAIYAAEKLGGTAPLENLAFLGREYTDTEIEEAIHETFKM